MNMNNVLEGQTQLFWKISRQARGRSAVYLTSSQVISFFNVLENKLGPTRPLLGSSRSLQDAVIRGGRQKTKAKSKLKVRANVQVLHAKKV